VISPQDLQLASTIVTLIGSLVWPVALIVCVLVFRKPLATFLENLGEFNVKGPGGVEASAKRGPAAAAAAVAAAEAAKTTESGERSDLADARDIAREIPGPRAQRRIEGTRILWVDDLPSSIRYERQSLAALGIIVDLATSTDSALELADEDRYRLIISDMNRPPDAQAGYRLLDALTRKGVRAPVLFYTSGKTATAQAAQAHAKGAIGITSSPRDLFAMVTDLLAKT
jgi:CheY-like chemotaxis protein